MLALALVTFYTAVLRSILISGALFVLGSVTFMNLTIVTFRFCDNTVPVTRSLRSILDHVGDQRQLTQRYRVALTRSRGS